ncbi:MAG: hypothetical protein WBQ34_09950 [Candidatus Acidiferrales bacterium]
MYYLITADHVIRRMRQPNKFAIRINHADGNSRQLQSSGAFEWWRHPTDKSVDAAVYPWGLGSADYPYTLFSAKRFVTPDVAKKQMIGPGDETFMVGLFRKWAGHKRITPMVRTGHIAMMADERMPTANYGDAFMHLIDSFSMAGFSGSPVFVDETVSLPLSNLEQAGDDDARWLCGTGNTFLLGLVHGIMPVRVIEELHDKSDPNQRWHTGITQVVPANQILEILNQPELLDYEKRMKKKLDEAEAIETAIEDDDGTQMTHAPKSKARIEIPIPTREQFERDLIKATRKREKK